MPCTQCQQKFDLHNDLGTVYFVSEHHELIEKTKDFLTRLHLKPQEQLGLLSITTKSIKIFFEENLDAIKSSFSEIEKENLKIYTAKENESINFQNILLAKPLQRYINFFDDKDFFDIINNESLTSHFQPIVSAKDNSIYGYETLARGVKADGSLMYPDELFSKSKRNDYNFQLDRLCRESALKTAAIKKVPQHVFINFLPTSIYDPMFCLNSTVKWANQLEFDPSKIVFEVVETELVNDQVHLKKILEYYRSQGFKIALDDVGEGYSSLNMLIELEPDIIKIDRNIISDIDKNTLKQSVYKALYSIAKDHNITVLAEGVETSYELETIKEFGVDLVQGYYFSKPRPEPIRKI